VRAAEGFWCVRHVSSKPGEGRERLAWRCHLNYNPTSTGSVQQAGWSSRTVIGEATRRHVSARLSPHTWGPEAEGVLARQHFLDKVGSWAELRSVAETAHSEKPVT
jgi:hypothetical protein